MTKKSIIPKETLDRIAFDYLQGYCPYEHIKELQNEILDLKMTISRLRIDSAIAERHQGPYD